jgi:RNA polymerase sigma-70 factor (ECF subfamily)
MSIPDLDHLTKDFLLAQDGDQDAFTRIVGNVQPEILRFSSWYGIPTTDIDDITQETLLRIYKNLNAYRVESRALSWVISIAYRVCLDYSRSTKRRYRMIDAVKNCGSYQFVQPPSTSLSEIADLISRLPLTLREAIVLVKIAELSYQEVATLLNLPIGTVQSRVSRARVLLLHMTREVDYQQQLATSKKKTAG